MGVILLFHWWCSRALTLFSLAPFSCPWFTADCCLVWKSAHFAWHVEEWVEFTCSFVCFTGCLSPLPTNHRVRPLKWNWGVHVVQDCDIAALIGYLSMWRGMFMCNCTSSTFFAYFMPPNFHEVAIYCNWVIASCFIYILLILYVFTYFVAQWMGFLRKCGCNWGVIVWFS